MQQIAETFGEDVIATNGEINRKMLGSIVFADREEMRKLEQIVWPHTKTEILQQIDTIKKSCVDEQGHQQPKSTSSCEADSALSLPFKVIVVEAAIILDADWNDFTDGVWMVTVPRDVAIERIVSNRENCSPEEAGQRIDAQQSRRGIGNLDEEVAKGTVTAVIDNSGTIEDLKQQLIKNLLDPSAWY